MRPTFFSLSRKPLRIQELQPTFGRVDLGPESSMD
jgi:hypothetical protein